MPTDSTMVPPPSLIYLFPGKDDEEHEEKESEGTEESDRSEGSEAGRGVSTKRKTPASEEKPRRE